MGGHLATITSKEENDWIASNVIAKLEQGLGLWIGGTSEGTPGQWRWITGEAFTFTSWGPNEPMNKDGEPALVFKKDDDGTLGWGDLRDSGMGKKDRRGGFLVEWDDAGALAATTPALPNAAGAATGATAIRLAQIEAQFKEAYERDAMRDYKAAVADLDGKYLAAIGRALGDATKAGKLEEVVALRDEKQRVTNKAALPVADPVEHRQQFEKTPRHLPCHSLDADQKTRCRRRSRLRTLRPGARRFSGRTHAKERDQRCADCQRPARSSGEDSAIPRLPSR